MTEVPVRKSEPERFKDNAIGLSMYLEQVMSKLDKKDLDIDIVSFRMASSFVTIADGTTVLTKFIEKSHDDWKQIKEKEFDHFGKQCGKIFSDLGEEWSTKIKNVMQKKNKEGNSIFPEDDINFIWKYIESMVVISIKWIHNQREPILKMVKDENGVEKEHRLYKKKIFPKIPIAEHAETFRVKLVWPSETGETQ